MKTFSRFALAALFLLPLKPAIASTGVIAFQCETTLPTTSFYLRTEEDFVVLKTVHHNGTAFMPIHEGIVVPNDFPYLSSVARILVTTGSQNEFRFPRNRCQVYGEGQMHCSDGETKEFGGRKMTALFLTTSKITEQAFGREHHQYKISLSLNVAGFVPVQEIKMNYSPEECRFQF